MAAGDLWLAGLIPNGLYRSTNGGSTWGSLISPPSGQTSVRDVAIDPRNGDVWLAGNTPDGLYRSTDGGSTWGSVISPPSGQSSISGVAIDPRNGDVWVSGSTPSGIYKSTDGGANWGSRIAGPSLAGAIFLSSIAIDPRNGDIWITFANFSTLYKSTDGGATWGSAISGPTGQTFVSGIAIDARNGDVWVSGSTPDGIYKSTDGGANWGSVIAAPSGQTNVRGVAIEYTWPLTTITPNAGTDQTVASGGTVTIGGTDTITGGSGATTISWSRVSGTGGSLSSTTVASPTFTAPTLAAGAANRVITWRKSVTNNGVTETDDVTVTVTAPAQPPVAVAPTVSINAVAAGDEGTTVTLGASVGAGGQYDGSVSYAWTVEGGTLNDATAAAPVWTRPNVATDTNFNINLRITVNGDGTTTRNGTSASRDATQVSATVRNVVVLPVAVAPTVSIDSIAAGDEGTSVSLTATVTGGTYDGSITYAWSVDEGSLNNSGATSPTWARPAVTATKTVDVNLRISVSGSGTNARAGTSANRDAAEVSATVRNVLPAASAGSASVSINAVAAGDEGTAVNLAATVTKGTGVYDTVAYAWTADEGTLTGADTATPTWTRPDVTATKNVTLRLVLTLQGTGTTATNGTSVALAEVTRSASVRDIPDTTAPVLESAETSDDGTSVVLVYSELLDTASVPAVGDFTLSPARTISGVAVAARAVRLTVTPAFELGDTITLDYAVGTNPIQDTAGNDAAALSGESVTNNVLPPYQVFDLEETEYLVGTVSKRWLKNPRLLVNSNLCPDGQTRYLDLVVARREDDRGGVFHFEPVETGTRTNGHDLSAQVESAGIFRITVGDTHFDFPVSSDSGGDEPYAIDFSGNEQTAFNAWRDANLPDTGTVAGTFTIWNGLEPSPFEAPAVVGQPQAIAQEVAVAKPEGKDPRVIGQPMAIAQELATPRVSALTYAPPPGSQLPRTRTLDLGIPSDLFGQDQWTGQRTVGPFTFYEIFASPTTIRVIVVPPSGWVASGSITLTGRAGAVDLSATDATQGGSGGVQGGVTLTWTTAPARAWGAAQNALTTNNGVTLGVVEFEFVPFLAHDVEVGRASGYIPTIGRPIALAQAVGRPHAYAHAEFIQVDLAVARPIALVRRAVQPITFALAVSRPYALSHVRPIQTGLAVGRPLALVKRAPRPIVINQALSSPSVFAHVGPVTLELAVGMVQAFKPAAGNARPITMAMALGMPRGYIPAVAARPIAAEYAVSRPHTFAHGRFVQADLSVGKAVALVRRGVRPITEEKSLGRPYTFRHVLGIAIALSVDRPSAQPPAKVGVPGRLISESETVSPGSPLSSTSTFVSYFGGAGTDYTVAEVVVFGSQINLQITKFPPAWPANGTVTFTSSNGSVTVPGGTPNQFNRITFTGGGVGAWVSSLLALDESDQDLTVRFSIEEFQPYLAADVAVGQPHGFAHAEFILLEQAVGRPQGVKPATGEARPITTAMSVGRPRGYITAVAARPIASETTVGRPHAYAHAGSVQTDLAVGRPLALVRRGVQPIAVEHAVGRVQGIKPAEGEAQPIAVELSLGRPHGFVPGVAMAIALDQLVGRPQGSSYVYPEFFPAEFTFDFGARNRTRSGGALWEWNDDDLQLEPPFGLADASVLNRLRIGANQIRFTDADNTDPGFSDLFKASGILHLSSPGVGMVSIAEHNIIGTGRLDPTTHPDWAAWWTAFSADITHELSIRFEIPGPAIEADVGRPVGISERTRVGVPRPIATEQSLGRPHAFAHAEFILLEHAVGRPQGITPAAGDGRPITINLSLGRPGVSTTRAVRPIASDQAVSRPHAFAHAEFVQVDLSVGRPRVSTSRAVRPIAQEQSTGRPQVYAHAEPIVLEQAVGMAQGIMPAAGDGRPITLALSTGRPRGYIPKVAAHAISTEQALGRPHAYAHAEFVQTDVDVGRPRAVLFGVPGSTTAGVTTTESHDFGARTLVRTDANSTWQFNANLTLPEPIMAPGASPILQAHVRANQLRFITTGGQNPGFSDAFIARGRVTWTRVGGSSFTIVAPPFDHLGRINPSTLDGYAEWWAEFSADAASELTVTWELAAVGFQPFLAHELSAGRPIGRTTRGTRPIAVEQAVGRAHAFAHAEFIQADQAVGRPVALVKRAVQPIAQEQVVGEPQGIKPAEGDGRPIALGVSVGRPRGYIPAVAARPIASQQALGRPHAFAHAEFIQIDVAVGRPIVLVKRAVQPIAGEMAVGRAHAYAHAEFIQVDLAVGRPNAQVKRAVQAITLEQTVGMAQGIKPAAGDGRPITLDLSVGRPRGYIPAVAARPIASEAAVGRPHAYAHAEFVQFDLDVGRPITLVKRAVQPVTTEQAVGRAHAYAHAEFVQQDLALGRPNVLVKRAIRPIAVEHAVAKAQGITPAEGETRPITINLSLGRPGVSTTRAVRPIAVEQSLGRAHAYAHAEFIQQDLSVGRPGVSTSRAARPITVEQVTSQPHAFAHAEFILVELAVGKAVGITPAAGDGRPIATVLSLGRPGVSTTRAARPIAGELSLGRAHAYAHAEFVQTDMALGRPRGYIARVAALPITVEQVVDRILRVPAKVGHPGGATAASWTANTGQPNIARSNFQGWTNPPDVGPFEMGQMTLSGGGVRIAVVPSSSDWVTTGSVTFNGSTGSITLHVSDALSISTGAFNPDERVVVWRSATLTRSWVNAQLALDDNRDIDVTIFGTTFVPYLAVDLSTSRPHGLAHAEFVQIDLSVGRPLATVKRAPAAITMDMVVGRAQGISQYPEFFPASLTWELEARNRTRSGGSTWEWNDDDLTLPPPFGTHSESERDRTRISATQIRITDPDNDSLGFSELLTTIGSMTLWSPSDPTVGTITFKGPAFASNGRFDPTVHTGWSTWWTAFSADATHELSIRWDIPGPAVEMAVGRPVAVIDRTKVGLPRPIVVEQGLGRAHAYAHAEFIQTDLAVGRPLALVRRAARPIAVEHAVERIATSVKRATRPIALEQALGRAHAYAHAEFIQTDMAVGRPNVLVKRAVRPIAAEQSLGRPHAFAHAEFILLEQAVGRPVVLVARAARPIAQEHALSRPHAFAHAEFVQTDMSVGMARGYLPSVAALPITQEEDVGQPHAFAHAEFILLEHAVGRPQGIKPAAGDGRPVTMAMALGMPRGYIPRVAARPVSTEQALGRPHAYAHAEFVQTDLAVGRPVAEVKQAAQPVTLELALGRPHAYAHAEFVQVDLAVGRPNALVKRAVRPIALAQAVGRVHAFAHAEFILLEHAVGRPQGIMPAAGEGQPIAVELSPGRPRGYIPAVAAQPIALANATSRPHAFAHAEFVQTDVAVGRPVVLVKRAVQAVAVEQVVGRAHAYAHAEFIQTDLATGRPVAQVKRAVRPIASEQVVGRPASVRIAGLQPIAALQAVGQPIAQVKRAARPIAQEQAVGRPHALAHTSAIAVQQAVGRPAGFVKHAVQAIVLEQVVEPIPPHQRVGVPDYITLDMAVDRPRRLLKRDPRQEARATARAREGAHSARAVPANLRERANKTNYKATVNKSETSLAATRSQWQARARPWPRSR